MRRLRVRLRRVVAVPLDRWRQRGRPVLSVVVTAGADAGSLDEAVRSVRRQSYRRIDLVVVGDASARVGLTIARRHARRDRRVTVVHATSPGLGAARRAAVARTTGDHLAFVDTSDTVTRWGLRAAMAALELSGSDLAVLPSQGLDPTGAIVPDQRADDPHARPARHVTLADRPDVLVSSGLGAKVFRRTFWDALVGGLTDADLGADAEEIIATRAFRDAAGIDITDVVAITARVPAPHDTVDRRSVDARFDTIDAVLDLLGDVPGVRDERVLQYLRADVPDLVIELDRADDGYLAALVERVPRVVATAPAARYATQVPAQHRVVNALLAAGRLDEVRRFVQAEGLQPEMHPSGPEPAGFTVHLPGWQVDDVPPEAYVLTDDQTAAMAIVRRVHHDGPDLVLEVAAWFANVDLVAPTLELKTDGDLADVRHEGEDVVVTSRQGAQRRYVGAGWVVTLRDVARRSPRRLTLTIQDGTRSGTATATIPA